MFNHSIECLHAGCLTDFSEGFDISTDNLFQAAEHALNNVRRTNHNSTDEAEIAFNSMAGNIVSGGRNHPTRLFSGLEGRLLDSLDSLGKYRRLNPKRF